MVAFGLNKNFIVHHADIYSYKNRPTPVSIPIANEDAKLTDPQAEQLSRDLKVSGLLRRSTLRKDAVFITS